MCTLHDFSVVKLDLCIRALLLDHILALKKNTRTPRVHVVSNFFVTKKKIPYVVTRHVSPSVCLSVCMSGACGNIFGTRF